MKRRLWLIIATLSGTGMGQHFSPIRGELHVAAGIIGGAFLGLMAGFMALFVVDLVSYFLRQRDQSS